MSQRCNGCHDVNSHTHECSFCGEMHGIECGCISIDHKETDLDLCLLCEEKTDRIIAHMVEQLHIEQAESKRHRDTSKVYKDAYFGTKEILKETQELIKNFSITV